MVWYIMIRSNFFDCDGQMYDTTTCVYVTIYITQNMHIYIHTTLSITELRTDKFNFIT